ncbi:MAG TPA: PAS domain S-box protein, partial [Anaerolineae bacterium]|nr:PAS domain S-box protein [Anaerolineae bacterium]
PNVLRTGQPEFYPEITDAMLEAGARDAEHLQLARELQLRSAMAVPLKAHGRIFGVLTFVWAESGHHYNAADLALAEELAHRAALAVDNARLYQEAQRLNTELEQRVIKRTTELQAANTKLEGEIAERKKVEEEFRGLLEAAPDAITIINPAGQIALINSQTEQLFGYTRHELLGQTIEVLMPLRFRDKHLTHRATYAKEARPRAMGIGLDLFGRHKDGREFPVEISLSPLQSEEGLLVISAIRDITWRKNMEVELDEIQHRLVESRERDRLQLGRELHDGPIQDLYGVAFGLEAFKETLDQVSLTQFRVVQSTLWQVISTLRFISSELRPQTLTPFGLEKAILSHVERFQEMHPELQVKLNLTPDGQTLPEGMRLTLFRIYQELLNNAAQHAQAGQVWIRYTLDSEHVVLEVKDNGRGFEAPQRWVELARQGQLGLVETQERVEAMGGQMKVDSNPGEGTLIRVVVPRPNPTE